MARYNVFSRCLVTVILLNVHYLLGTTMLDLSTSTSYTSAPRYTSASNYIASPELQPTPLSPSAFKFSVFKATISSPKFISLYWNVRSTSPAQQTQIISFLLTITNRINNYNNNPFSINLPGHLSNFLLGPLQPNTSLNLKLQVYETSKNISYYRDIGFNVRDVDAETVVSLPACELNCNYPKGQQNLECTKCVCTTNSFQGINCNEPVFSPIVTSAMAISNDSIYIEWTYDPNYYLSIELDSFLVEVTDVQSTYCWSLLVENSARNITIKSLETGNRYSIQVTAMSGRQSASSSALQVIIPEISVLTRSKQYTSGFSYPLPSNGLSTEAISTSILPIVGVVLAICVIAMATCTILLMLLCLCKKRASQHHEDTVFSNIPNRLGSQQSPDSLQTETNPAYNMVRSVDANHTWRPNPERRNSYLSFTSNSNLSLQVNITLENEAQYVNNGYSLNIQDDELYESVDDSVLDLPSNQTLSSHSVTTIYDYIPTYH